MFEQTTTYDDNGDLHGDNDITVAAGEKEISSLAKAESLIRNSESMVMRQ